MIENIARIFKPAPFTERLPGEKIDAEYRHQRTQIMLTIFLGYAAYYFVRTNFSLAKPYLIEHMGFTKGDLGLIATAGSIAYGLSKFLMGNVSDRSNPRYFFATGLILSGLVNLFFGFLPSVVLMTAFWFVNGWFQGMGWPPCARTLTHWFSDGERGRAFAVWNLAHNVGGGLVGPVVSLGILLFVSYKSIFYLPACLAVAMGVLIVVFLRDTPQSVGLPPIEEFKNDYPATAVADRERELTSKEIFLSFVFNNRFLWILAFANIFAYVVRYGVVTWAPTYLSEVKGCNQDMCRFFVFVYESAGIPAMLLTGWLSDRVFNGRRGPVSTVCMALAFVAVVMYWKLPPGSNCAIGAALAFIGFAIYGPIMLIGIAAVDLVPKKAAGTAAGFTGLFGYFGGTTIAELGIGRIVQHSSWDAGFMVIAASALLATVLLAFTWNVHDRSRAHGEVAAQ